jgi:glycosyltransferase involved in cell wall biosynthesis
MPSMPPEKIPCSVLILTRNSATTLGQCMRNLQPFGDILVRDGNSEDDTVAIAKKHGARVLPQYDTAEKSVRIKDFTEMQLRQRADALYDWVFYLDSDEYIADELVQELAEMIPHLPPKTVIKLQRFPVVDGVVRTRGLYCPEVVPRIHHRKSGCTLKTGKVVHEKYVYDDSFVEVVATHPLYYPLDPAKDLRSKDDRYITLEIEKIRRDGYKWSHYFRWKLFREPLVMLSLLLKIVRHIPQYGKPDALPFEHEWRYVRYHWRLLRAVTGAMLKHPLTGGKVA